MNGFVSFGEEYAAFVPVALPDRKSFSREKRKLVCPFWSDLQLPADNTNGNVYYKVRFDILILPSVLKQYICSCIMVVWMGWHTGKNS